MSTPSTRDILIRLGKGERIAALCAALGWTRDRFDSWWKEECRQRVPAAHGDLQCQGLEGSVRIGRDRWGIPHIRAEKDADLFFGYGYATAQDRLFQLDYLRRKARGRLAEILGPEGVESDLLHRTVGLGAIADHEWTTLPKEVQTLLAAYTAGINAFMDQNQPGLPIEFDLLDYRPEPWSPADSLAILGEFRWYLTGRFPIIAIPELVKRTVGDGKIYQAFMAGELDEESILQRGEYPVSGLHGINKQAGGLHPNGGGENGPGSNNWVLAGFRTNTGQPIVASDPHIPFGAVSIWQEVHLDGGSFKVVGVGLAGTPAVMIGRNENVAWGITNNICMQRDLYQEKTDPAHPGCYLYDGQWEKGKSREETIQVRGAAPIKKTVVSSRNGPIVDDIMPAATKGTGPVALRWLGFEPCGWLTAMIGMNRAANVQQFKESTRPWVLPTFSLVYADRKGHIGYHAAGRIPLRNIPERGYRPGWDLAHQWQGVIPFESMPQVLDPQRGYVATANNRPAPDDFPYPLSGCWSGGYRHRRCREMIEAQGKISAEECKTMQYDCLSGRAQAAVPLLLAILESDKDPQVQRAVEYLRNWDRRLDAESVPGALFNVFFIQWCKTVCRERFPGDQAEFIASLAGGLALHLLGKDDLGWFQKTKREPAILGAFRASLDELATRVGPDMDGWHWGGIHQLLQKHFLSSRGDLGVLLDRSGLPCDGDGVSVCSGQADAQHMAALGAGYRMVADLADPACGIWAVEVASVSGHPGSPHYDDQLEPWSEGQFHYLPLLGPEAAGKDEATLTLKGG